MNQHALAQRAFFLKQFDASISHELVIRALDKLADLRDASFYFQKGEEHRLRNEISLAISYYERALKIDPEHEQSLFYTALCYIGCSDQTTGASIDDDVGLKEEERLNRSLFLSRRLIALKKGNHEIDSLLCICYHNQAVALLRQEKYNAALDSLNCAIQISATYVPSYRVRAITKLHLGLAESAMHDCEYAIELDKYDGQSYLIRGKIQSAMGEINAAIESFREAIEQSPSLVFPYIHLNKEYSKQGKFHDAIGIIDEALSVNPYYPEFYYVYARTQDEFGSEQDAVIYYSKFLRMVPAGSEYYEKDIAHAHERLQELQKPLG
jgi:tetratricopeptide (TPR) repeat protein